MDGLTTHSWATKQSQAGFWLLGLFNNFAYVIMLSAAHDLLKSRATTTADHWGRHNITATADHWGRHNITTTADDWGRDSITATADHGGRGSMTATVQLLGGDNSSTRPEMNPVTSELLPDSSNKILGGSNSTGRDCNPVSTGAILLADVLPAVGVKLVAPFFPGRTGLKVGISGSLAAASFLIVSTAQTRSLLYFGVVCASLSSGLGEVTFLSYTHLFPPGAVSAWSSGTGGAGVLGAGSYAALTALGLSPNSTLLVMLVVPLCTVLTFCLLLQPELSSTHTRPHINSNDARPELNATLTGPSERDHSAATEEEDDDEAPLIHSSIDHNSREVSDTTPPLTLREKVGMVGGLLAYMVPLGLVYFLEYLINQGLFELLYFPHSSLDHHEQYRWYQLDYQLGVLISRSSLSLLQINNILLLAALQGVNLVLMLTQAIYSFIPSISIVFMLVFWEGLLGGAAYVNTFHRISREVTDTSADGQQRAGRKEFALGFVSVADSSAIGLAGAVALRLHDWLCQLPAPY